MDIDKINDLIRSQENDQSDISRIFENIKKDSSSRKTQKYIDERRARLDSIYQRAFQNHRLLCDQEIVSTNKYITLSYFDNHIKKIYDMAIDYLAKCKEKLDVIKEIANINIPQSNVQDNDDMNKSPKLFIQKYRINQLKRKLSTAVTAIAENRPAWYLQSLTTNLEKQFYEIEQNHLDLLMEQSTLTDEYYVNDHFSNIQEELDYTLESLQEKINERQGQNQRFSSSKLPRITLPIFKGSYESWNSFYDLFKKIIDDDYTISTTEKMQYLKTHVQGDAEKLIKHLPVNEVNYKAALTLLMNRYKDERLTAQTFIDKLLDLPKLQFPNAKMLRTMHDCINESLEALKNQNIDISTWNPILTRLVSRKWDQDTNMKYEDQLEEPNKLQDFSKMMKFLEKRFKSLESSKCAININSNATYTSTPSVYKPYEKSTYNQEKKGLCWYCKNEHNIHYCQAFKELSVHDRIKKVQEKQMCYLCLMHDTKKECVSQKYKKCEICNKAHSTLLHRNLNEYLSSKNQDSSGTYKHYNTNNSFPRPSTSKTYPTKSPPQRNPVQKVTSNMSTQQTETQKTVLLATALVQTYASDGTSQLLRVLCDQGSEVSLCTEEVAQLLGFPKQKIKAEIKGIADEKPKTSNYMINVTLKPRFPSTFNLHTSLLVLPKLTGALPKQNLQQLEIQNVDNKIFADPTYYKRGPVDVILGAADYSKLLLQGYQKLENGMISQNTEFGWIFSGFCSTKKCNGMKILSLVTRADDNQISQFWELEEITDEYQLQNDDQICENYYQQTTQRNYDGTYTVRLPFKNPSLEYGNSRQKAAARLIQLEKKLEKNPDLRSKYNDFMKEYLDMNHMKKVNKANYYEGIYYIPHQPVIRDDALTTKLRTVFDASSTSSTNVSLNDNLHKGPRLQQDMDTILLRWRKYKFVFMADIEKMYRFIKIHADDLPYQRILWRWSPEQPIEEYELTTVTYGTTAAPYLAIKTLQQLAIDEKQNYPLASDVTLRDFYVDDILSGENDIEKAKKLQTELIDMLRTGGFNLRKWSANSAELLENIPEENVDDKMVKLSLDENRKSLGLNWSPKEDKFIFKITTTTSERPTKRFILSEIAKLFDPLGWFQPVIITMKMLVQDLWISGIDWNDIIPEEINKKWTDIQNQLKCLENIEISRWTHFTKNKIEFHGFSDASEKAYGACVYCRTKVNDIYYVTLLQAKTKVAPINKKTTLPRLELCAAVLLTKLMKKVVSALLCNDPIIYCWTDSMITLGWIKGQANKWQTFIANRVSEIQQILPNANWNHVISTENPADVISRGICPSKLQSCDLWWNGPKWLLTDKISQTKTIPEPEMDIKRCHQITTELIEKNDLCLRFSSFNKMIRVLSYCLRFLRRTKTTEPLTCEELENTKNQIIFQIQKEAFAQELQLLQKEHSVKNGSQLSSLDPFIDENGLLRVGGRLQNSQLPYDQKHPIVLPYKHHLTTLIVRDAHQKTLHGGNRLTLSYLQQKYWILRGKQTIKTFINKCVMCIRHRARTAKQKMGALPKPRVTQSYAFTHTGCDFAGPIQVRTMKGRGHKSYKGYIAVFICLATKAIHLELVGDLSTESFIAALRRFMARRGQINHIYTDNASNFVGAANFLQTEILEITQSPQFQSSMTDIGIQWHFIPPVAPHFGGLWEAGVKSMKYHLKRVVGDSTMTYEELSTFLHQIEACLNSRPICIQSDNIYDNIVLTPSHFIIGREAVGVPDPISNINTDLVNRWKCIQKMKKDFWKTWSKDYLNQLQQRYKWKANEENLKLGTVVIMKDENISPSKWPLALIKQIHPGTDGTTRVVTLQRSQGTDLKRAIHTLIPLPVNSNIETSETIKTPEQSHVATVNYRSKTTKPKEQTRQMSGTVYYWLFMLFTIIQLCSSTEATYINKNLKPGLYIEQMGNATLDRGTFRIEKDFKRETLDQKLSETNDALKQFKQLCDYVITVSSQTHCTQYYQHLHEEVIKFEKTHEYLSEIRHFKKKRGLLGEFMTSIFGVNDEVYRDIGALQKNQEHLIDSANHQTKFMISAISTLNQTETRIQQKIESFRTKINQAISYVNNNNVWYRSISENYIHIQVLQCYQLAVNYLTEINDYYAGLMEIYIARATMYSVMSPRAIGKIIKETNSKLPANLNIIQTHLIDTKILENDTHIRVLAYFPIAEKSKYTLMHITPIPAKHQDGTFQGLDIPQTFIGLDYNNERYFELTHEEYRNCLQGYNNFICFPVAVKNMQLNQNCIVKMIIKTEHTTDCPTKTYNILNGIIWKQVQMSNTWLYLTKKEETVSIVCDGKREEVSIHDVGIIQISENCIIKTISTTLAAKRVITVNSLASYVKNSQFKLDYKINSLSNNNNRSDISKEQVLDNSKDIFNNLVNKEKTLQTTLDNTVWSSINTQTYLASFSSLIIFSLLVLLIYCCGPQMMKQARAMMAARRREREQAPAPAASSCQPNPTPEPSPPVPIYAKPRPSTRAPPTPQLYEMKVFS